MMQRKHGKYLDRIFHLVNKLQRLILHLRLWKWAAVKRQDFNQFEIGITKIIRFKPTLYPYGPAIFHLEIWLLKPQFYLFEPGLACYEFCRITGTDYEFMYPDDVFYYPQNQYRFVVNHYKQ